RVLFEDRQVAVPGVIAEGRRVALELTWPSQVDDRGDPVFEHGPPACFGQAVQLVGTDDPAKVGKAVAGRQPAEVSCIAQLGPVQQPPGVAAQRCTWPPSTAPTR